MRLSPTDRKISFSPGKLRQALGVESNSGLGLAQPHPHRSWLTDAVLRRPASHSRASDTRE
jgi:hypothetical protein